MKIVIPMAGLGTRFSRVADTHPNYCVPKPFIKVRGIPMVRWATGSLPFCAHPDRRISTESRVRPSDLVFIILAEHNEQYGFAAGLREIYTNDINIIELPKVTRGAAESAFAAHTLVGEHEELLITDSDHYFDGSTLAKTIREKDTDVSGIIPMFRARNDGIPKWSYSLVDEHSQTVTRVAEKDPGLMNMGAYANIGGYYFSRASLFFQTAEKAIRDDRRTGSKEKAEFFIAPLYQDLINSGNRVMAAVTPEVWGLGTPDDLNYFLEHNTHQQPLW